MESHEPVALALDIGGTKVAAALVRGAEVVAQVIAPTPAAAGPEAVVAAAVAAAKNALAQSDVGPAAVGAACAGAVHGGLVRAISADLMPGWHGFPLVAAFESAFGLPVTVVNDAQAAAYGEWRHGAGHGRDSLLFVTVSTGVGGGLILGGRLWRGSTGLAGHIGHIAGGEVERLASGTALARRAAEAGYPGVDAREVIAEAVAGSEWAGKLVDEAACAVARALADVKVLLDPELVVLGGGVGLNADFRKVVASAMPRRGDRLHIEVTAAGLGAAAGLVGAGALAAEMLNEVRGEGLGGASR